MGEARPLTRLRPRHPGHLPPVAWQGEGEGRGVRLAALLTPAGARLRVARAGQDGRDDPPAGPPGAGLEPLGPWPVPLPPRLLPGVAGRAGVPPQPGPRPHRRAEPTELVVRSAGAGPEAAGGPWLEPRAVHDSGLAAGAPLERPGRTPLHREATGREPLVHRAPGHTGRCQGHGREAARLEPVRSGAQRRRDGAACAPRWWGAVFGPSDALRGGTAVDAGRLPLDLRPRRGPPGCQPRTAHTPLRPLLAGGFGPCRGRPAGSRGSRSVGATGGTPGPHALPTRGASGRDGPTARQRARGLETMRLPNGVNAHARPARRLAPVWRRRRRARASHP